jgi:hypothetical protein
MGPRRDEAWCRRWGLQQTQERAHRMHRAEVVMPRLKMRIVPHSLRRTLTCNRRTNARKEKKRSKTRYILGGLPALRFGYSRNFPHDYHSTLNVRNKSKSCCHQSPSAQRRPAYPFFSPPSFPPVRYDKHDSQYLDLHHIAAQLAPFHLLHLLNRSNVTTMSFGRPGALTDTFKVSPPQRGSFPLDHDGESCCEVVRGRCGE